MEDETKQLPWNKLRIMNVAAAILQGILGLIIVFWLVLGDISPTFKLDTGEYQGDGKGRQILAIPPSFLVQLLIVFTFVTGLFHVIYATHGNYDRDVNKGLNTARWVEYSITASVMILVVAVSSGVYSLDSQILIVTAIFCCMLCGLLSQYAREHRDRLDGDGRKMEFLATGVGWVLFLVAYGIIVRRFFQVAGEAPDFVKYIIVAMGILYGSFGIIHLVQTSLSDTTDKTMNRRIEGAYIIDSFVSKVLLVILLFTGLAARSTGEDGDIPLQTN
jgi:hypothetical protein